MWLSQKGTWKRSNW